MVSRFSIASLLVLTLALSACGGGGGTTPPTGGGGGTPTPPPPASAFVCPTSTTSSVRTSEVARSTRPVSRRFNTVAPGSLTDPRLLEVTYDSRISPATLDAKTAAIHAQRVSEIHFDRIGRTTRVIDLDPSSRDAAIATLRATPGVVAVTGMHRYRTMLVTPFETNDPMFDGTGTPPLFETASQEGQWDMHVIGLDYAFGYSQPNNGSQIPGTNPNPNALGSTSVRLAIIDTGTDVTHPELANAPIVRTQCFITDPNNVQSTGSFVPDPDGHGTDVTGIAADQTNNNFAYAGAGGNVSLLLYRVFPKPDDTCTPNTPNPPAQCTTTGPDVASAINDAVANGANVINMSFGGDPCSNGQDPDSTEGGAVANAIAHNVIVVAAAGNSGKQGIGAPGCDPGVIAVGASAYNDKAPNGSGFTGSRAEYVPTYSQYGATNTLHSTSSWGLVAPGGDATSGGTTGDMDLLHWIDNIWTSTPFDTADAGSCQPDSYGDSTYCRILIDGTSMSTPHVAGAAALVLSVNSQYQSPTAMYQLLCSTADSISDPHQGCGRLDVYRAVATALKDPQLP